MTLQTIKSIDGQDEYVLLPVKIYKALREEIEDELAGLEVATDDDQLVPFVLEDYIQSPVSLARIRAGVTQKELAKRMGVTQAYISKIENQDKATPKLLEKVNAALMAA